MLARSHPCIPLSEKEHRILQSTLQELSLTISESRVETLWLTEDETEDCQMLTNERNCTSRYLFVYYIFSIWNQSATRIKIHKIHRFTKYSDCELTGQCIRECRISSETRRGSVCRFRFERKTQVCAKIRQTYLEHIEILLVHCRRERSISVLLFNSSMQKEKLEFRLISVKGPLFVPFIFFTW